MVSPISYLGMMDDLEYLRNYMRCFASLARVKKLKDTKISREENEARYEVIKKNFVIVFH